MQLGHSETAFLCSAGTQLLEKLNIPMAAGTGASQTGAGMGMIFRVTGEAETLLLNPYLAKQAALPARMGTGEAETRVLQQQTQSSVSYHCRFETPPKKKCLLQEREKPRSLR